MSKNICKEKMALVEKLGLHIEQKDHLAPVEARILSYIILTGKKGSTFEDLVSILCASKSTISTHLAHLQDLNRIEYFTKTGDRKKYFISNKDMVVNHIEKLIKDWHDELDLHQEIKNYKETINSQKLENIEEQFDLNFHVDYIKYLNEASVAMQSLRTKLISNKINI